MVVPCRKTGNRQFATGSGYREIAWRKEEGFLAVLIFDSPFVTMINSKDIVSVVLLQRQVCVNVIVNELDARKDGISSHP